jgi:MFS family permease
MATAHNPTTPHAISNRRKTGAVILLFLFMLLHQTDKFLIGPLTTPIMETFGINEAQMGAVLTGAILVGAVFFPLWGYLYDRYARPRILSLAALLWGLTTWLGAIVPTYPLFVASRATTGIDDASYPGIYSMVSDYFGPQRRGRIIATLQMSGLFAFIIGTGLAFGLRESIGWRGVFFVTGGLGVVMAVVIRLGLHDAPRGASEPQLAELAEIGVYRFNGKIARSLLRNRTLFMLFFQQFVHLFPIQAISFWFFRYLEVERGLSSGEVFTMSVLFVVMGAAGYLLCGSLGDAMFRRTPRGRVLVGGTGIILAAIGLGIALSIPAGQTSAFMAVMSVTAVFINFAHPVVIPSIHDITAPEVRSTAHAMLGIAEQSGSALAPLLVGIVAVHSTLRVGLLTICGIGFGASSLILLAASLVIRRDVESFRALMQQRALADGGAAALSRGV